VRAAQPKHLPIEFLGYVQDQDVPEMFRTSSLLVMPYDSSTGSSGPAHQACEFGLPIICADIPDFRCMAADDDMAINYYKTGDAGDLADNLVAILQSPELQRQMALHNYQAGIQMTMASVVRNYLRWFELHRYKRAISEESVAARGRRLPGWRRRPRPAPLAEPASIDAEVTGRPAIDAIRESMSERIPLHTPRPALADDDNYADAG
jgi:hypothetical protein